MSRYGFEESIRDGATKPLHFEPRLLELHIDQEAIDEAFKELTGGLSDLDRDQLAKTAAKMAVLVKAPERIQAICADIAQHFQEKVAPNGFGAQVVTFDRESCVLYKQALDEHLPPEVSDIVMSVNSGEDEYARLPPRPRRRGEAARPLPRPDRPAEDPDRHLEAAHRLRRADPAGDVPRQAAARPHPAAGDLPHEPALRRGEDPRPDRRLPRHLRRRGPGAPVRRRGHHAGSSPTSPSSIGQAARGDAEVPGLLPRRRPHRRRATRG